MAKKFNTEVPKKEEEILKYWEENKIYKKWVERLKNRPKFYYLDGPPYANGQIHLGHAWGKALRDMVMRFKRKKGFDVYDRPGFDMHGLPIEKKVEQKLNLEDKTEIGKKVSVEEFIKECKEFSLEMAKKMIEDFKRLGVFMNWENPYYSITNEFIANAWFGLKKAYEKGLIYEGETVNYYCEHCVTVLAKHELEYKEREDPSIFIRMKVDENDKKAKELGLENSYFLVWTTTPWTLPFNLGIMVNPNEEYVLVKVEREGKEEEYIIAKKLLGIILGVINAKLIEKIKEFKGKDLEGVSYKPLFNYEIYKKIKEESPNAFTVWLADFVSMDSGTGLVHGAPGCGPEDFEIGKKYGVKPFNLLDDRGFFGKEFPDFQGLRAKVDDNKIIEILKEKGILVFETTIAHQYAHCWRCKNPIIFKTTKQWFIKVSSLKDKLLEFNKEKVNWVPKSGKNAFNSWLNNLQDWVISRQRYWGIPIPIWKCEKCGYWELLSLEDFKLRGQIKLNNIKDYHIPYIDKIKFVCPKCEGEMKRVNDILDVWLDSGTTSWNALDYPHNKKDELLKKYYPIDFIVEGKDQIRGWFNTLASMGMIVFDEIPYRNVYMHGFINDAYGRKMSKSLGNVISPYEVIDQFGADAFRYYAIGGTAPGEDLNYNHEDIKVKFRNLNILRNTAKYLREHLNLFGINPKEIKLNKEELTIKEKYILHILNSRLKEATELMEKYELNRVPWVLEEIFLELSKFYIKTIREELANKERVETIMKVIYEVLFKAINAFSIITPFTAEEIYLNTFKEFEKEESINFFEWPEVEEEFINEKVEELIKRTEKIIEKVLSLREKEKINVRWPLKRLIIEDKEIVENKELVKLIKEMVNVKEIVEEGKEEEHIWDEVEYKGEKIRIGLHTKIDEELFREGFTREIIRRVQMMRKELGLTKDKEIEVFIEVDKELENKIDLEEIKQKTNAKKVLINELANIELDKEKEFKIKEHKVTIKVLVI